MTEHDKADQARKGLIDSVKGKAKEVVGAVVGNDSLTAEGQLEQTQAHERQEANSVEAVADAQAEQARVEMTEAKLQAAQGRVAVSATAAAVEDSVQAQQNAQKLAVEQAGRMDAANGRTQAELNAQRDVERAEAQERVDAKAAAKDALDAVDAHETAVQEADGARTEADRIRRRADGQTNQTDLP